VLQDDAVYKLLLLLLLLLLLQLTLARTDKAKKASCITIQSLCSQRRSGPAAAACRGSCCCSLQGLWMIFLEAAQPHRLSRCAARGGRPASAVALGYLTGTAQLRCTSSVAVQPEAVSSRCSSWNCTGFLLGSVAAQPPWFSRCAARGDRPASALGFPAWGFLLG
jgi:hypothetical protein